LSINFKETEPIMATVKSPYKADYALVNGLQMYYEIHSQGEPLILIHGGGSTIQTSFGKILPMLAKYYKVIAVELQAHGHTKDRDTPESFEQDAADVVALLNQLKINKASFLGFSNGGQTSMQIGMSYPDLVNKLVIVSAFYTREGAVNGFFESMPNATLDSMPPHLQEAYLQINGNDSNGLQRMFEKDRNRMIQFKGWSDQELASIKAPALIIAGDKDVMKPEHTVQMASVIPNSQLMILPGNHGSFIGEGESAEQKSKMPELVVEVIREFLDHQS
jgi:pimeloyl-ACP methyl ester carboxylesterase